MGHVTLLTVRGESILRYGSDALPPDSKVSIEIKLEEAGMIVFVTQNQESGQKNLSQQFHRNGRQ